MAFRAEGIFFKAAGRIGTEPGNGAAETVGAVVKGTSEAARLFENEMAAGFFGDGSAVASQRAGNGLKKRTGQA